MNVQATETPSLPTSRIKKIMKKDNTIGLLSAEAIFVTAKATELFLAHLAEKGYDIAQGGKRKTIKNSDLLKIIQQNDNFQFLDEKDLGITS
ncbi:hypothetical protein SARC_00817 [Sphaeroforma arctica JP610]|uniref:Transcription factor CBF/NF-Y/archaeal histone domain-containing protein n=1 Tax=Sphaeroforma arctica JP610 TaxID=667725 RepID=A0A0L0GFN4_9EUKA|nr:hypothetical protein SARC_00817 [Sphaeroforma arctica JP610]KNC87073.1 hypothetical protein SARC_00817 [Sphaeroforma arctica JP610]|eukprot:XP_014160975.1 hypothetical protein SARC_00817 [Sphaeroforma arctica JP610]